MPLVSPTPQSVQLRPQSVVVAVASTFTRPPRTLAQIAEDGADALAAALARLGALEDLRLLQNGLRVGALAAVAPVLPRLTRLTALDLAFNDFASAAAAALAPRLARLTCLERLSLAQVRFWPLASAMFSLSPFPSQCMLWRTKAQPLACFHLRNPCAAAFTSSHSDSRVLVR